MEKSFRSPLLYKVLFTLIALAAQPILVAYNSDFSSPQMAQQYQKPLVASEGEDGWPTPPRKLL